VWGKIIGGVAGFAFGGPWGALAGASLGHAADTGGMRGLKAQFGFARARPARIGPAREEIFAVGIVVITAKLAKVYVDPAVSSTIIRYFQ
jgi:DnaJ like chaperone protein